MGISSKRKKQEKFNFLSAFIQWLADAFWGYRLFWFVRLLTGNLKHKNNVKKSSISLQFKFSVYWFKFG